MAALIRGIDPDPGSFSFSVRSPPERLDPLPDPSAEVDTLILEGKKIAAIKQYRDETGAGLREAKDAVKARGSARSASRTASAWKAGRRVESVVL